MQTQRSEGGGFSAMGSAALLSVFVFFGAVAFTIWENTRGQSSGIAVKPISQGAFVDQYADNSIFFGDTSTTSEENFDPISLIGPATSVQLLGSYSLLLDQGTYTQAEGEKIAQSIAPLVTTDVNHFSFTEKDIKTDQDSSYDRMMQYRGDLQESLAPLLKNTQPELELFASYTDTKDTSYLAQLRTAAENYRAAASSTALLVVPKDAVIYHLSILNAMTEFAAVLDALTTYANDPFASVALLRAYNSAEEKMFTSFNAYGTYYASKK